MYAIRSYYAQIAGSVWRIERAVGDDVAEEEVLLIVESMKMEIPLTAPVAGTVSGIHVAEGDEVSEGQHSYNFV